MKTIEKAFHDAGLSLKPWHRQDEIFAVDIDGGEFLLARGNGNTIRVIASDPSMQQLVLMVHEHPRSFQVDVTTRSVLPTDTVIKREPGSIHVTVLRRVSGEKRHLLLGLDEMGHPFVAQLARGVHSLKDAHEALKPEELQGLRVRGRGKNYRHGRNDRKVFRQGEWFFIETTPTEQEAIDEKMIERKTRIGLSADDRHIRANGTPHIAAELVSCPGAVYVRGAIRHPDHKTIRFHDWMRVVRNTEAPRPAGMTWVD